MNIVLTYKPNHFYGYLNRLLIAGFTLLLFSSHVFAGSINLAWDASTSNNVGGYKLYYGTTANNYTSNIDVGNKTSYQVAGLINGTNYYFALKAYDSARTIESAYSNVVGATTPSVATLTADFSASKTSGTAPLIVTFTPSETGTVTTWKWNFGSTFIADSTSKIPAVTYSNPGTYNVTLTVTGSNGNFVTQTKQLTVTAPSPVVVSPPPVVTQPPVPVTGNNGLVAAYRFDEDGSIAVDASGNANHGIINGTTIVNSGRYNKARKFNGTNDMVTINESKSLDLSSGLTLESWIKPISVRRGSVILKEQPEGAVYNLYSYEDGDLPLSSFNDGIDYRVISGTKQLPINQWTHLASTYDGRFQRLYVNGLLVSTRAQTGLIKQSNGALRIGGNSLWGEYFQGYIDEVRIYNRALTNREIKKDLSTAISKSNPAQLVVGNKTVEPYEDYTPQGIAQAFKTNSLKDGAVTAVQVFLDANSTATELVAGIYSDNGGHPGELITQGKLISPKAGVTNTVRIPAVTLAAAKSYWISTLGSKGQINFRIGKNTTIPTEMCASTGLTSLPNKWLTGIEAQGDGPMTVYGTGY